MNLALADLVQEASKHGLRVETAIVAEAVLVQVRLQISFADRMINASQSVLHEAPETFDGIGVDVPRHINLLAVVDAVMNVSTFRNVRDAVIAQQFVRKHRALGEDMLANNGEQRRSCGPVSSERSDFAATLHHSDNHNLVFPSITASNAASSANVSFVNLYSLAALSANRFCLIFCQHGANLLEHPPRGFIGHTRLTLNLFRRDAATSGRHQIHRIEPRSQRSRGFVEDRASRRVNVVTAIVTAIRWATDHAMMLSHALAILALDAVRVEMVLEPFKTGCVIWELGLEGF